MSRMPTEELVETLSAVAAPVRPLAPPWVRAAAAFGLFLVIGAIAVALAGDPVGLNARYAGREMLMMAEMAAMTATAATALLAAFSLSIPGAPRRWLALPFPFALAWILLSGLGCYQDLPRFGAAGWTWGHSSDCLVFLLGASAAIGAPLLWALARARPLEPLPVALLGGLGAAALSALLLQFFHPFGLTVIDLTVHFGAVLVVTGIFALLRGTALRPA